MINPHPSQFPAQPVAWSEIARLCRRICLLRECGQPAEAEHVRQGALQEALATLTAAGTDADFVAHQLESIFAAEAERVANAAVLAELLRPMLGAQLNGSNGSTVDDSTPRATSATPFAPAPVAARAEPSRSAPGDIASFIDDMLAQERTPPHAPGNRRVS